MEKILVIKSGAAGDVVRTTTLFNILKGSITWVVNRKNATLFPEDMPSLKCVPLESPMDKILEEEFDLLLSLEEDEQCAKLASLVKAKRKIGIYWDDAMLKYTNDSSGWFDMSLCSAKGRNEANRLKKENRRPFQHWLFQMVGKEFKNEPYRVYRNSAIKKNSALIGIERRTGDTWPNKHWGGYDELSELVRRDGFEVREFHQRERLHDYMDDISSCACIICGDTLAMHLALAYQVPCITIFNCTSPYEIHPYGELKKIVSPMLTENFYSRAYSKEVIDSVPVEKVYKAFKEIGLRK